MMTVSLQFNKEEKMKVPYHCVPIYQLFCEQLGLQTQWNQSDKILQLTSQLQDKRIYIKPAEQTDMLTTILDNVKMFLKQAGVDVFILDTSTPMLLDGDITLQLKIKENNPIPKPQFHVLYNTNGKSWATAVHQECKKHDFAVRLREDNKKQSAPSLELRCKLPDNQQTTTMQEVISLLLASSLLKGFVKDDMSSLLPLIYFGLLKNTVPTEQRSTLENNRLTTDNPNSPLPIVEKTETGNNKIAEANPFAPPLFRLEVCLDYQLLIPTTDEDHYLILGNIYMKNTGLGALINPYICFHVNPADEIQLKGQIIPPKMLDTVGVQSFNDDQAVGWRYVEEDWFQKAKEQGEYWICPIQPLAIPPGETFSFSNFQFSIPVKSKNTVSIQASIHFKHQNLQFPATNQIVLSFS